MDEIPLMSSGSEHAARWQGIVSILYIVYVKLYNIV